VDEGPAIRGGPKSIVDWKDLTKEFLKYREFIQLLQKNVLNRILAGNIQPNELRKKCALLDMSFDSGNMRVALIRMNTEESGRWKAFAALNVCDDTIRLPRECYIFPDAHNRVALLFHNKSVAQIRRYIQRCMKRIHESLDEDCVASIGAQASTYRDIRGSYENAGRLLNYQLICGATRIFSDDDFGGAAAGNRPLSDLSGKMASFIAACDRRGIADYIEAVFGDFHFPSYAIDPDTIKYEIIHLVSHILNEANALRISPLFLQAKRESIYVELQSAITSAQLRKLLTDFSLELIGQLEALRRNKYSPAVKQVVEYVHEKYHDYNISLKTQGCRLNINPAYLGRIFRQETGEFFSDYLTNIRVLKAKNLLLATSMKTNDIAEAVGFSSTSYFYTAFKKVTGQKPSEVRK
jgi:two-component system response regulator YesN